MKVVRFNKSGGAVSIKITVTGLVAWKYVYRADEKKYSGVAGQSNQHAIGLPGELELDYNKWVFRLLNQADADQPYHLVIVWEQDGGQIDQWEANGSLTTTDRAKRVTDDCILEGR